MASSSQECMDADYDCQNNNGDQADGHEDDDEEVCRALRDSQHGGESLSVAGSLRKITDRGYARLRSNSKV
jgi:hypothetical protein